MSRGPLRRLPGRLLAALAAGLIAGFLVSRVTTLTPGPALLMTGQPTAVMVAQLGEPVEKAFAAGQDPPGTVTVTFTGADVTRLVREINAAPVDPHPDWAKSCLGSTGFSFYRLRFAYLNGDQTTIAVVKSGCTFIWAAGKYADRFGGPVVGDLDSLYARALRP